MPKFTVLVIGAYYDVTIFGKTHRFGAIDAGRDICVSSLAHRCCPREVGSSDVSDCEIHWLNVAAIIITVIAQVRYLGSRSCFSDAANRMLLDLIVCIRGGKTKVHDRRVSFKSVFLRLVHLDHRVVNLNILHRPTDNRFYGRLTVIF